MPEAPTRNIPEERKEMDFVSGVPALTELVLALEHATLMAKQLPTTAQPSEILRLCSSLHNAHQQLGAFLARVESSQPQASENVVSSAAGDAEPMEVGDDEAEQNSKIVVEKVEERMRDCVIQNKRRKRPPSPLSAAATERPSSHYINSVSGELQAFDPEGTRLRSLELLFQFHG